MRFNLLALPAAFLLISSGPPATYAEEDFARLRKFDAHVHANVDDPAFAAVAKRDGFEILSINVDYPDFPPLAAQAAIAGKLHRADPSRFHFATTFSMKGFGKPEWTAQTNRTLAAGFRNGAVAVKVWKNIGMVAEDAAGRRVFIDDPRFDGVMRSIQNRGVPLIAHQGEPRNCWLPLDQMTTENDRAYFKAHPEYYMYLHPEEPSYEALMAARDRFVARHPRLAIVGAHMGSLEWSVDELARFLDRHPNATVDLAARMSNLQAQSVKDRERVRAFLIKYADRLLYGTDLTHSPPDPAARPQNPPVTDNFAREASRVWRADWRYLATAKTQRVDAINAEAQGLALPRAVIDRLYYTNARRVSNLIERLALALVAVVTWGEALASPVHAAPRVTAIFRPSDADFANPERGFYRPVAELVALTPAEAKAAYGEGYRLLYTRIDLSPFRDRDLSPALLAGLDTGFANARAAGVKLIVRAAYNYPQGETAYRDAKDAPLPRVLGHLDQLRPVFRRNADVIAFVQAGLIGAWGEWHSSSNNLTTPAARTQIKDALLAAVPRNRFVQFRNPPYIAGWTLRLPPPPAALDGGFRMGFHNDCFLASATDVGTYSDAAAQRAAQHRYITQLATLAPFGGETCNPADDPGAEPRSSCMAILDEGQRYRLTYLNAAYYRPLFHDQWAAEGCMDEVRTRMGYRFTLEKLAFPGVVQRGRPVGFALAVRNAGWARLYNPRPVALVLRGPTAIHRTIAIGADPRTWLPDTLTTEKLRIVVPRTLPAGRYRVSLALPDMDPRIAGDSRFAVRFANADDPALGQRWDQATGTFETGTTLTVIE